MRTSQNQFQEAANKAGAAKVYFTKHELVAVFYPPFSKAENFAVDLKEKKFDATDEGDTLENLIYDGAIIDLVFDEDHVYCEVVVIP